MTDKKLKLTTKNMWCFVLFFFCKMCLLFQLHSHTGVKSDIKFFGWVLFPLWKYNYLDRVLWGEVFLDWVQRFGPTPGAHNGTFTKKKTQTHVQQIRTEPPTPKLKCFLLIYTKKHPFTVMIVSIKNTCNFMGTNSKIRSPVFTSVINNETPEGRSTVL